MLSQDVIDSLFPADLPEPEHWEQRYPPRDLPAGAKVTRFAPSPTGFLHIGGVFTAIIDADVARQSGGVYLVRLEDTDRARIIEGAEAQFAAAFSYFSIEPDEHGGLVVGLDLGQRLLRPRGDQLVGAGKTRLGGEHRPRVGDDRAPADELRRLTKRFGGVNSAINHQPGRRSVHLREYSPSVDVEQTVAAPTDHVSRKLFQIRWDLIATAGLQPQELGAGIRSFDDRQQDAALTGGGELRQPGQQWLHGSRSRKTSISPPHGSPTSQPWSSAMP